MVDHRRHRRNTTATLAETEMKYSEVRPDARLLIAKDNKALKELDRA